ncbi:MAG: aminotransferase class IV [Saprospiraceae bacterium]
MLTQVSFMGFRGQFLETICILDGMPQHLDWHQRRINTTMQQFFPEIHHEWELTDLIRPPVVFLQGMVRCRVLYDQAELTVHYFEYGRQHIHQLKLIVMPDDYDYRYKYADRDVLENLYTQREEADDVLMTRDGWITDTSIANIAFKKNGRWYTPSIPLLAGTTWKRLVSSGILIPTPIHKSQLGLFESFKIFNAMRAWEVVEEVAVKNIYY